MGGGITGGQRGDLLAARPPSAGCPAAGHAVRVVEGTSAAARSASASAWSCAPAFRRLSSSVATPPGSSREAWAAARSASAVTCCRAPASRRLPSRLATPPGSSRGTWAAARPASAVTCSCAPASRRLSSRRGHGARVVEGDVGGGAGGQRGDLVLRARLPQPVQQRGHEPGRRGGRGRRPSVRADVSAEAVRRVG